MATGYTDDDYARMFSGSQIPAMPDDVAASMPEPGAKYSDEDYAKAFSAPKAGNPALGTVLDMAAGADSKAEARKGQLARELGRSPVLLGDVNEAEIELQKQKQYPVADIQKRAPMLAESLYDAHTAKVSQGSVNLLVDLEQGFRNIGGAVGAAAYNTQASYRGILRSVADVVAPDSGYGDALGKRAKESSANAAALRPVTNDIVSRGIYGGIESAATTLMMLPLALATRNPLLLLTAVPAAITGGGGYNEARDAGKSVAASLRYMFTQGGIEALTEVAPGMSLIKNLTAKTGLREAMVDFLAKDIPNEQIAAHLQAYDRWQTINPTSKTFEQFMDERPEEALEVLIATVVGGAATVGAVKSVTSATESVQQLKADRAIKTRRDLEAIAKNVANTPLKVNDPKTFHAIITKMTSAEGVPSEVYIDATAFIDAVHASKADLAQLRTEMPDVFAQLDAAVSGQGDLSISVADYYTYLSGTPLGDGLLEHIVTDQESGMTYAQAKAYETAKPEMEKEAAKLAEAKALPVLTREEFDAQRTEVKDLTATALTTDRRAESSSSVRKNVEMELAKLVEAHGGVAPTAEERQQIVEQAKANDAEAKAAGPVATNTERREGIMSQKERAIDAAIPADRRGTSETRKAVEAKLAEFVASHGGVAPTAEERKQIVDSVNAAPDAYDTYLNQHTNTDAVRAQRVDKVKSAVSSWMVASGRFTPTMIEANMIPIMEFFITGAERERISIDAFYARYPLTITGTGGVGYNQFAGPKSATADVHALTTAQQRIENGEDAETVRKETGWHVGIDKKWRYEISDDQAVLKGVWGVEGQTFGDVFTDVVTARNWDIAVTLGEILDHPALFAAYPALANVHISLQDGRGGMIVEGNSVVPPVIYIGSDKRVGDVLTTLIHEIQHGIQTFEGFATGGTPDTYGGAGLTKETSMLYARKAYEEIHTVRDKKENETAEDTLLRELSEGNKAWDELTFREQLGWLEQGRVLAYTNLAGEAEARNAEARARMTAEERKATDPKKTLDVAEGDIIVRFNGRDMASAPTPANAVQDQTETAEFKTWAGDGAKVIEADDVNGTDFNQPGPFVLRVHHGTTHEFDVFDASVKGNVEGHFGAVNYFTSSEADAEGNYTEGGADLTARIELRAEGLADDISNLYAEYETDEEGVAALVEQYGDVYQEDHTEMARTIATREMQGDDAKVLDVFVRTEKPFIVNSKSSPWLQVYDLDAIAARAVARVADDVGVSVEDIEANIDEYQDQIDEASYEIRDEEGNPLVDAVQKVSDKYDLDLSELISKLLEEAFDGRIQNSKLEDLLLRDETLSYAENDEGKLIHKQIVAEVIQALGFDSIIIKNAGERFRNMDIARGTAHVHVFTEDNTNIKSATDNSGAFSRRDANIYAQGLYSVLDNAIASAKQTTASAKEWLAIIPKLPGVKKAEVQDRGLEDFLNERLEAGGKITKVELQAYLAANATGLKLDIAQAPDREQEIADRVDEILNDRREAFEPTHYVEAETDDEGEPVWFVYSSGSRAQLAEFSDESDAQQKADDLNDEELDYYVDDVHMPAVENRAREEIANENPDDESLYEDYTEPGGQDYRVMFLRIPTATGLDSPHFGGVGDNAIAHVRVKDRQVVGTAPSKVLFIEEIQSDWAQAGREKGFVAPTEALTREEEARFLELLDNGRKNLKDQDLADFEILLLKRNAYYNNKKAIALAPFVTDTGAWTGLALKRMLVYAVENGYDSIAWTTGAQQNERYKLSKKVKSLSFAKSGAAWRVRGYSTTGSRIDTTAKDSEGLAAIVGKVLADKVINDVTDGNEKNYEGLDLDMGGSGMVGYYDKIVPNATSGILKKLGVGEVGSLEVAGLGTQQGIVITQELRDKVLADGLPLYQTPTAPQGTFDPRTLTISLLKGADMTTVIHESGHFYLDALADMASRPGAPESVVRDFRTTLDWFGVTPEAWAKMTLEEKRPYHEQWSRSYERFTMEGKAPTTAMQPVFTRFRAWFFKVYTSTEAFIAANPAAGKLNDDIRAVYGRLIASKEDIEATEKERGYTSLFASAAEAGISDKDYSAYLEEGRNATDDAITTMHTRDLRNMKWLSGAKNRAIKELQAEANDQRDVIRAEVTEEVMAEPINVLRAALKNKENPLKLHTGTLKELIPNIDLRDLRGMTHAENGVNPDQVADMFGFQSGADMVDQLLNSEKAVDKIKGLTDQRMLERHGDLVDDRAVQAAANEAVVHEGRAKFLATGLAILLKTPGSSALLNKGAKDAANQVIGAKRIRDLKPHEFAIAERKANKAALRKLPTDPRGAIAAQRAALINNRLSKAATGALADVDKGLARMARLQKSAAQGNMRGEFLTQLNALMERFDLRKSRTLTAIDKERLPLGEWMAAEADRLSAVMPDIPAWVLNGVEKKHYKDLTVTEFAELMEAVKGLELLARREEHQYQAIRGMNFATERAAILARIQQLHPEAFDADGEPKGLLPDFIPKMLDLEKLGDGFVGEFVNAENIISILEGGEFGQVHESLFGRMNHGVDAKASMMAGIFKDMKAVFSAYSLKERYDFSRKDIGAIGRDRVTRENVVVIALLHGSADGRERLVNYGWSEEQQAKVIGLLDSRDLDLVEAVWKTFDVTLWPQLKDLNERTRGKAPPKVEAATFTVNGRVMAGGYFRLKYDTDLDARAERMAELDAAKSLLGGSMGMTRGKTAQGTSTERKDGVTMRPRLDLGVFAEGVAETVHDITLREPVADTVRLLSDKGIRNVIVTTAGKPAYDAIMNRVKEVAAPPINPSGFIEKAVSVARRNTVVTLMSGLGTALQNFTGFTGAMARVSPGSLALEIAKAGRHPIARIKFCYTQSKYMENRGTTYDRDLQAAAKKMTVNGKILPETSTMLFLMGWVDKAVTVTVWNAAFRDGMGTFANDRSKSIDYADHIVRQTQGSGRDLDVSKIMAGHGAAGEVKKTLTMFYSYFNGQLGALVRSGAVNKQLAKTSPIKATALFTKDFLLVFAIPAILTKLLFAGYQEDEEDEELQGYLVALLKYGMAMIPLLRDIGSYALGKLDLAPDYGYKMSPIQSGVEGVGKGVGALYDIGVGDGTDKDTKDAIMGVSYAVGLPGALVAKTVTGTKAIIEGEVEGVEGTYKAIVYGAPPEVK